MKDEASGRNRLSRVAAKEVPHRTDDRLFAAKADVKKACEDLLHDLRHSSAHRPDVEDLTTAVNRVLQGLKGVTPEMPKASSEVRETAKEVQRLQLAHTWVSASERVASRLGANGSTQTRNELAEAQHAVMWCVRAQHWDGQLTAAISQLQKLVRDAEANAARVAG